MQTTLNGSNASPSTTYVPLPASCRRSEIKRSCMVYTTLVAAAICRRRGEAGEHAIVAPRRASVVAAARRRGTTFASAREPRPWCCASRGWTAPRWRARRSRPSAAAEWPLELESAPGAAEPDDSPDDSPRRTGLEGFVSRTLQVAAALVQQEQAAREARKAAEEARLLVFVAGSKGHGAIGWADRLA